MTVKITDRDVTLPGTMTAAHITVINGIGRSQATQENNVVYPLPIADGGWRTWDARQTVLPGTAAADDLAIITGTFGTDVPTIQGSDFGGTSITQRAARQIVLPPEYVSGQSITLRFAAGMLTTVADDSCTLDVEAYLSSREGAVSGADLCSTGAQSINSLTYGDYDFTLTPTARSAGDLIDVRITIAGTDSGNAGVMIPEIGQIELLLDVKG